MLYLNRLLFAAPLLLAFHGSATTCVRNCPFLYSNGAFISLAVPGATATSAIAVSNFGVLGYSRMPLSFLSTPYVYSNGLYKNISPPVAPDEVDQTINGINDAGTVVGSLELSSSAIGTEYLGYSLTSTGAASTFSVPGARFTFAGAINAAGTIVGAYEALDPVTHNLGNGQGFIDVNGLFTTLNAPYGNSTYLSGIDDNGVIAGYSAGGPFTYQSGVFTSLSNPPGILLNPVANDSGTRVGKYIDIGGYSHGVVEDANGVISVLEYPNVDATELFDIANNGDIIGSYSLAQAPEPSSLLLVACFATALAPKRKAASLGHGILRKLFD